MVKQAAQLVSFKVDAEKGEGIELAKKYKVRGFPTILFLDSKGEIWGSIGGYMPPEGFAAEMEKVVKLYAEYPALMAAFQKNARDPVANAKMVKIFAARGKTDDAEKAISTAKLGKVDGDLMAGAYNALADYYQMNDQIDKAIPHFNSAIQVAKTGGPKGYASMSLGYCYLMKGDQKQGKAWLEKAIAVKGANPGDVATAKETLKQLGG